MKFFPLALILSIVTWTNINLKKVHIRPTSLQEMKAWFGIHIMMGLVKINNYKDYWSSHPGLRNKLIAQTMKRNRYDTLSQHIACSNPDKSPDLIHDKAHRYMAKKKNPLHPMKPVWEKVRHRCLKNYRPRRELTIDEAMVKYRGFKASVRKFFMPLKPIRTGFKIYVIAESATGFFIDFIIHPHGGTPTKMVDIAMKTARHTLGVYHHIFTDRLYTSVSLARTLLTRRTYLTGAVKANSKGLPRAFSSSKENNNHRKIKKMNACPRGTFYTRQNGQLTSCVWKDSRVMTLLSSAHQGWRDPTTGTVVRKVANAEGRLRKKTIPAPPQAVDYIKNMGGLDRGDQLRAYHTCSRKSQFWWVGLLYFMMDVARVNAWLCYKQHHTPANESSSDSSSDGEEKDDQKKLTHSKFVLSIATDLIDGFASGDIARQPATRPVPATNSAGHYSVKMPGRNARWCRWCRSKNILTKSGLPKSTRRGCRVCGINLCPGKCFLEFHASVNAPEADSTTSTTE